MYLFRPLYQSGPRLPPQIDLQGVQSVTMSTESARPTGPGASADWNSWASRMTAVAAGL
ncbi:uncharacterized protein METZ01_LOCUS278182, partial [marine metagenome]